MSGDKKGDEKSPKPVNKPDEAGSADPASKSLARHPRGNE